MRIHSTPGQYPLSPTTRLRIQRTRHCGGEGRGEGDSNRSTTQNTKHPRRAFTLLELMITISVITILIALLLPAIQRARESARLLSCRTNLSMLGLAVQQYEQVYHTFPLGSANTAAPIYYYPQGYHVGWLLRITPYLEQRAIFQRFDWNESVYANSNAPIRLAFFPALFCPSAPYSFEGSGLTSYAACHHHLEAPIDIDHTGMFVLNTPFQEDDISDGLGNTIMLGETLGKNRRLGWITGTSDSLRNTGTPINGEEEVFSEAEGPQWFSRFGGLSSSDDDWYEDGDEELGDEGVDENNAETQEQDQGHTLVDELQDPAQKALLERVGGFGSHHERGAQFVMGDGSVRFISEQINPTTYQNLGNREDANIIGEF